MPSPLRLLVTVSAAALLALPLAACSSGDSPSQARTDSSTVRPGSDPSANAGVAEKFFVAVASNDPDDLADALEFASPDSLAAGYLTYLGDAATAIKESDGGRAPDDLTRNALGYKVCRAGSDACVQYSRLVLADGKVSSFTIGGRAIDERTALGKGTVAPLGDLGTVEFLNRSSSTSSDLLFLNLHVVSEGSALTLQNKDAIYRQADGEQYAVTTVYGPDHLDPGSDANVLLVVRGPKTGPGALDYAVKDVDGNQKAITLRTY